ncbi:MAG TPA: OmpA family protein, partial [Vicinamibacterales bacterium]
MSKPAIVTFLSFAVLAGSVVAASAQPRVTSAVLGHDRVRRADGDDIVGPTTEFRPDTPKIACVLTFQGIRIGTPVKSVWIAEDVGSLAPPNYRIGEKTLDLPFMNSGSVWMTKPDNGWPVGTYRLEIYIGSTLAKTLKFSIRAQASAPPAAAATTQAHTSEAAQTAAQESEMTGVTTEVAFLRQYGGALHAALLFKNTTDHDVTATRAFSFGQWALVDAKSGRKSFALRDESGHFLAGPISDWNDGGRWFPRIAANGSVLVWAVFDTLSAATVDITAPLSQPFDAVAITLQAPSSSEVGSTIGQIRASLVSAARVDGQLKVRIKLTNPDRHAASGPALRYADAYVLDPASRKKFGVVRDEEGHVQAQPISDANEGGRLFLSKVPPGGQIFVALTFTAPPDSVQTADIVLPWLDPFEHAVLTGQGNAADAGSAVAGRTIGLDKTLEVLHADVTPQEIKINLSADVLFDFDKADLKPDAAAQLGELATVTKAYPGASIRIDGYTDGKGNDRYNQTLSEKRAGSVAGWLTANGGVGASQ